MDIKNRVTYFWFVGWHLNIGIKFILIIMSHIINISYIDMFKYFAFGLACVLGVNSLAVNHQADGTSTLNQQLMFRI